MRKAVRLGQKCPGKPISGHGAAALKALALGRRPQQLSKWPDGSSDSQVLVSGIATSTTARKAKGILMMPEPGHPTTSP